MQNPDEFGKKIKLVLFEGEVTGETLLKTIENIINGGKEDIGEPERRTLNEIKEIIIDIKTSPEMELITKEKLNSKELLNKLDIEGIEKFNPDDTKLFKNVKNRLEELEKNGETISAFKDIKN